MKEKRKSSFKNAEMIDRYAGITGQWPESHPIKMLQQRAINMLAIKGKKVSAQKNEGTGKNKSDCF